MNQNHVCFGGLESGDWIILEYSQSVVYKKIICFSRSLKSWNDVTFVPSLLFLVSRFCTPPEVKFDAFGTSKHGEGKSLSKNYLLYLSVHWGDLIEQITIICRIHFTFALENPLLGQMFIFRAISQPHTLSADIPAAWRGLFTNKHRASSVFVVDAYSKTPFVMQRIVHFSPPSC